MGHEKAREKLHMLMEVFMMGNGMVIKNMAMGNINTLMRLNIMGNGKKI